MSSPLRERRRRQTEREIQIAALTLALDHGIDGMTTEMIARQAGISPRTFFNYFANKEAALIGIMPPIPADAVAVFVASDGPLGPDLLVMMQAHLAGVEADREIIVPYAALMQVSQQMRDLYEHSRQAMRAEFLDVLGARLGRADPLMLGILTNIIIMTCHTAFELWLSGDEPCIRDALNRTWTVMTQASALLSRGEAPFGNG